MLHVNHSSHRFVTRRVRGLTACTSEPGYLSFNLDLLSNYATLGKLPIFSIVPLSVKRE